MEFSLELLGGLAKLIVYFCLMNSGSTSFAEFFTKTKKPNFIEFDSVRITLPKVERCLEKNTPNNSICILASVEAMQYWNSSHRLLPYEMVKKPFPTKRR